MLSSGENHKKDLLSVHRPTALFLILVWLTALTGCTFEDNVTPNSTGGDRPILSVSPRSLDFNAQDSVRTIIISNAGLDTLEWTISCDRNWIETLPGSGSATSETYSVTVRVHRSGLSEGIYTGTVTVQDQNCLGIPVTIRMSVRSPRLSIEPLHLDFGSTVTEAEFTIVNIGGGTLNWRLITLDDWITFLPTSGCTTRESDPITVRVNRSDLERGQYDGEINVFTDAGDAAVSVRMDVGRLLWSFYPTDNAVFDRVWECYDDNAFSGYDFWGVVTFIEDDLPYQAIWCNGRGEHSGNSYSDNMDAWMVQRSAYPADIRGRSDVDIRFQMRFQTESPQDYVRLCVFGADLNWYYLPEITEWSGDDYIWRKYIIPLNYFSRPPHDFLLMAFKFNSDIMTSYKGAYIKDIEVWGD